MSLQVLRVCLDLHKKYWEGPVFFLNSYIPTQGYRVPAISSFGYRSKEVLDCSEVISSYWMGPTEIFLILLVFVKGVCQAPLA